ncbi:MAG TPA: hypothetical protein VGL36_15155 [Kribbella sp.]
MKDRFGEDVDLDAHPTNCSGWEDPDADVMRPCLICKPHLDPAVRRRQLFDADQIRATRPEGDAP